MRTMRAAVFTEPGAPLEIEELVVEDPHAGEVLVRMAASGVCRSDYHVVVGEWTAPTPIVLGHEGAGIVESVGEGVTSVKPGDHVILSWTPSCGRCRYCVIGRPNLCELVAERTYASVMFDGTTRLAYPDGRPVYSYSATATFGEYTVVPEAGVVPIRSDFPLEIAALIGCGLTTGVGAVINTANVEAGASVLVIGCGGVGLAVIQGAALAHATPIIAVDRVQAKVDNALRLGATHAILAEDGTDVAAAVKDLTDGAGVDYAFEAIGVASAIESAIEATAPGGTMVVVGQVPEGVTATFDPFTLSDREKVIRGCNYGSARPPVDFPRLVELCSSGAIDASAFVTSTISLDGINEAFARIGSGEGVRSVIVF
jgi:S-(hydroxymethyl)glutathione dehydrogenase / alcohol dehydrogenase